MLQEEVALAPIPLQRSVTQHTLNSTDNNIVGEPPAGVVQQAKERGGIHLELDMSSGVCLHQATIKESPDLDAPIGFDEGTKLVRRTGQPVGGVADCSNAISYDSNKNSVCG